MNLLLHQKTDELAHIAEQLRAANRRLAAGFMSTRQPGGGWRKTLVMSPAQPVMIAKVVEVEEVRLRNGKRFVSAGLDRSHADVLRFHAPLETNRPASTRKRRKAGLPEHTVYGVETWLVPPGGAPRQVIGDFGFVDPITAPATFSLADATAADVPVGSELQLKLVTTDRNG